MVHSLLVYYCLGKKVTAPIWKNIIGQTNPESVLLVALFHDLCKINFYKQDWKNAKIYSPSGSKHDAKGAYNWESVPIYSCDDQSPLGHGEKSVIELLKRGLQMTDEEIYAIRWHMGFTDKSKTLNVGNAFKMCPLAFALSANVYATALALAPLGVSANNQERLPVANGRMWDSHKLFEISKRPSSRKVSNCALWPIA